MPRTCTICSHAQRTAIEADRQHGVSYRTIADRYTLTETSLKRHCASHMAALPQPDRPPTKRTLTPSLTETRDMQRPQGQHIPDVLRRDLQALFLERFCGHGILTRACREAGVTRETIRQWEEHDETFGFRYVEAKEQVNDLYRDEARRRALDGVETHIVSQGKLVRDDEGKPLVEHKYSDTMLQFIMKARMPEYREKQQMELTGKDGGAIQTHAQHEISLDLRTLTPDQLAALRGVLEGMM